MKKTGLRIFLLIGLLGGIFATNGRQAFSKDTVLLDSCCGAAATETSDCCASKHASCPKFISAARPTLAILATKISPVVDQIVYGLIERPQNDLLVSSEFVFLSFSPLLKDHLFEVSPPLRAPPASSLVA